MQGYGAQVSGRRLSVQGLGVLSVLRRSYSLPERYGIFHTQWDPNIDPTIP